MLSNFLQAFFLTLKIRYPVPSDLPCAGRYGKNLINMRASRNRVGWVIWLGKDARHPHVFRRRIGGDALSVSLCSACLALLPTKRNFCATATNTWDLIQLHNDHLNFVHDLAEKLHLLFESGSGMAATAATLSLSSASLRSCSLATVDGAQFRRPNYVFCCAAATNAPSVRSTFMGAGVGPRFGLASLRSLRGARVSQHQQRRSYRGVGARAAWAQEVLWATSPVAEVDTAAEDLYHVVLDISDNPELMNGHTKAGQFVQVKIGTVKPAFLAIASAPTVARKGRLEFLIKDIEGSTAGMICSLRKGDKVELSQVMGSGFPTERLLPAEENKTVLLFATGSGISPIRSLIEAGFEANKRSDVRLYYGARNLERMAYQDKFKAWESSGVQVIPVLSQPGEEWTGAQGYVQAFFSKNKAVSNGPQTGALLCGHKQMALDVTALLVEEGVPKEKILLNF
ncbi:hypothetical protein Mapa_005031 [Marchantia paleacea]|nr:hypothetical protein Mapa_005031 [Marchantia paleacea]